MWVVTYSDGSTEEFEDMSIELLCSTIDKSKEIILIEHVQPTK